MIDSFLRHNQEKYLAEFASRLPNGYTRTDAGEVAIFHPMKMNNSKPSILVAAGWHGDEQGATLGLMDFVSYSDAKFFSNHLDISYIPLASASSNHMGTRGNTKGQDPNALGSEHQGMLNNVGEPSSEIQGLLDNLDFVLRLARNGYYTMHEDPRDIEGGAYVYYEGDEQEFMYTIVEELKQWMDVSDEPILTSHKKDSFEHFLHGREIPEVICIETNANPQMQIPEKIRRIAHMNCLRVYCQHIVALGIH